MKGRSWIAAVAVVGWFALALQLYLVLAMRYEVQASLLGGLVNFFSYFTVLSNTLAAAAFTAAASVPATATARFFQRPGVVGGITCSLLLVGIAYSLLLRSLWQPQGWQWLVNELLHDVMPLLCLGFWWWAVPRGHLRGWHLPLWALYPVAYFGFTLLRGQVIGTWPYPFLDVGALGYPRVLLNALMILAGFLGIGAMLWAVDRHSCSGVPSARQ
ncbi:MULTISPECIES: Pr6Pr family membrane protein [unclassified Pseudomonas]|uniref:Pr6Pr family membrane protein n=1 Tax=unclassified Pseudomonas TaxID=196821 RepID=UPI000BC90E1D|nr:MULTISPECIES: Pr6Pr family membrane protein [unclassified Pseudomonas]PVZ13929.1 hypothetical protein F474_03016 [Pseudomonas sp. URIL14HWK12:I12]PVZ24235.1 hypothetical protein F470_02671 [Pseudomonas sp. URIL14HWK12:I10]PVZ33126.1 hypothetical protein F472_02591 [Pseudomonas sp. URIL14HWK12:I11]SNZ10470.1 hypothetical protein SAMN05660463_01576 [Pseudomonas sp. URIL14HWK12:I9]